MGRPKKDEIMETYSIRLTTDLVARIDLLAAKADIDRSRLIRNILQLQVETLERADKVGIFSLVLLLRDMEESLKGWADHLKADPGFLLERCEMTK